MAKIDALTGNECVAVAVKLCKPDLIAAYPITPQSSVVEKLASMASNGELSSEMVTPESEHSVMSILKGAAMAGKRVFTATAAQGLALMYEPYFSMSTMRLPAVMAIATREMTSPQNVWSGLQDALSVRDAGWLQLYAEDNQEVLDTIIQAYKITENPDVRIPINVCYDGFYLSHQTQRVEVPDQKDVDEFLPPFNEKPLLDPDNPIVVDPNSLGFLVMEYREDHVKSMENALKVIIDVNNEFAQKFGRDHGGLIQTYETDDADEIIVTIGATTGAAREAVDYMRERGIKVGLLRVRSMRPFPDADVANILKGRKAFGVIDKSVCFGWRTGILYEEVNAALGKHGVNLPSVPFIGGLGGSDIRIEHIIKAIRLVHESAQSQTTGSTVWLKENDYDAMEGVE